jgi:hypothetical protein
MEGFFHGQLDAGAAVGVGGVCQAGLHAEGQSVHLDGSRQRPAASVAQLAEQLICNQQVAGSIPAASSAGGLMRSRLAVRSVRVDGS